MTCLCVYAIDDIAGYDTTMGNTGDAHKPASADAEVRTDGIHEPYPLSADFRSNALALRGCTTFLFLNSLFRKEWCSHANLAAFSFCGNRWSD